MSAVPGVEHPHVERLVLLRKLPPVRCLNDAPFRLLHILTFSVFCYLYFTSAPNVTVDSDLPTDASGVVGESLDAQPLSAPEASTFDDADELDGVVISTPESNSTAGEEVQAPFEIWEPKVPHDYVLVVWAFVTLCHALVNLFCVWMVRVKVFCKFGRVRTLAQADHVLCKPTANHGHPSIAQITTRDLSVPGEAGAESRTVRVRSPHNDTRAHAR